MVLKICFEFKGFRGETTLGPMHSKTNGLFYKTLYEIKRFPALFSGVWNDDYTDDFLMSNGTTLQVANRNLTDREIYVFGESCKYTNKSPRIKQY